MSEVGPVTALIVAAGSGSRLPGEIPKVWRPLGGRPLLLHALEAFDSAASVGGHVLVVAPDRVDAARGLVADRFAKPVGVVAGGPRRQDSVALGLAAIEQATGSDTSGSVRPIVAVHDAARPFPDGALIERVLAAARRGGAAIPVVPVTDTVREIDAGGRSIGVVDRRRLRATQTPQAARLDWLIEAYRAPGKAELTDEGAALERTGRRIALVDGSAANMKITTPEDWAAAEAIVALGHRPVETRIGYGEDRHPRSERRPFVLAGVVLAERDGPAGHSDGDPLCHALVDAVLGASASGSIGDHFPDTDPAWKDASGLDLLARAVAIASRSGFSIVNVDAVVVAETPRLAPHVAEIKSRLAAVLGVGEDCVSVKGKRAEGLGFESVSGVSCRAVALLAKVRRP